MQARGIERQCARQCHTRCVFGIDPCALTQWRDRRAHNALGEAFLINISDIEDFEAARSVCGVEIFAPQNNVLNIVPAVLVCFGKNQASLEMFTIIVGVRDLVQMAANDRLRFIRFCPNHGMQPFMPFTDVSVAPKKVDRAGAEA